MASFKINLTSTIRKWSYALAVTAIMITVTALMAVTSACGSDNAPDPYGEQPVEKDQTERSPIPTIELPPTRPPLEIPPTEIPGTPAPEPTPQPGEAEPPSSTPTPPATDGGDIVGLAVGYAHEVPGQRYPVLKVRPGQAIKLRGYALYADGTYGPIPKDPLRIPTFVLAETPRLRLHPGNILEVLAPVRTKITLSWDEMVHTVEVRADPHPSQTAERLTGMTIHPEVITLTAQGETQALTASGTFVEGSTGPLPILPGAGIGYSSTDTNVAEVSYDGILTALNAGSTDVRAHFGPHRTETPARATVTIQREDPPASDQECLFPNPEQRGTSIPANRLKVTLNPAHNREETIAEVAERLGAAPAGQAPRSTLHVIEFPCPGVPEDERPAVLKELALLLMEQPEVVLAEHMIQRTPTPPPTAVPSGAMNVQVPTVPNSAGDLTVRMDTDPRHIRLQPGESWGLRTIILQQTNRSTEQLPLDSIGLTFQIAPMGDDHPRVPYLDLITVDDNGMISAGRRAPTSSVLLRARYLGHTVNLRVDIRGGNGPGSMNALDCAGPGSFGDLMIEFKQGTRGDQQDQITRDLLGTTTHNHPAFNGSIARVPCDSPGDMTQAVADALGNRAVANAYPYIPTPGDAAHELWRPAFPTGGDHITMDVGDMKPIEPMSLWDTGSLQPMTQEERDCVLFQYTGDPTVASVDPRTGAVTGHRPGYGMVTVESCGYGPPVTVYINVYSKVRTQPSAGPTLNEIRIETNDRQVLLRAGDSEPISIWAAYNNGQEVLLDPQDDEVEFATNRVQVQQDETGWNLTYPREDGTEEPSNERITTTYRNVTTETTVLLRPAIEAPPDVDEQCRYSASGIAKLVTADTVAVHMDRRARTEGDAYRTAQALGATIIGRSTHQDWNAQTQYLLRFPCNTGADLQDFQERAAAHAGVLNMRHHPENPAGSKISEIEAGPDITMQLGLSAELEIRAHLFDGTIRPVPESEQSKIQLISYDESIVTAHQNREFQAQRTGRTSVGVLYEDLADWATVTVLPAPIDDQCVFRTTLSGDDGATIIEAEDLREISFTLQKEHGEVTAEELATALGRTLDEGPEGPEETPTWRAQRSITCQNGMGPQEPTIEELRAELSDLRADPRVTDASFTTEHVTLALAEKPRPPAPADFGWLEAPPAGQELQGLAVQIIGADRIYPSDRVQFIIGGDYGDDVVAALPQGLADTLTVMPLTEATLFVGPNADGGSTITALRPGNGQLRFEIEGYRKTVGMTVQEDMIKMPDLATGCEADIGGTMVAHDQAAITMNDGHGTEDAKAVATDSGSVVIWTDPDEGTHLLERACLSFEEGREWAELLASRYDAVDDAHLHVPE